MTIVYGRFWVVFHEEGFGNTPAPYSDEEKAKELARSLSRTYPGQAFHVLTQVGGYVLPVDVPPEPSELSFYGGDDDEVPF